MEGELYYEIDRQLKSIEWGSLEIQVQNGKIVQLTKRHIQKFDNSGLIKDGTISVREEVK